MPDQVRPPAPLQSTGNVPGRAGKKESPFFVPPWLHFLGSVVHQFPGFWLWLGRLESSLLEDRLNRVSLQMPIYISGLARSGSTLLHEVISSHPQVATL